MKGKHSKLNKKNKCFKIIFLLLMFFVLIVILLFKSEQQHINSNLYDVKNEIFTHNEKLVLKSNFEESREKKIIYFFKNNVLLEVKIFETYMNLNEYITQKEDYSKKINIEILETNDNELTIYYQRLNLGTDENLTYQQIYDKYTGIIGAYEIINE